MTRMSSFHNKKGFVKYSRGPHPVLVLIIITVLLGIYYGPNELKKADIKVKDFFTQMENNVEPSSITPSASLRVSPSPTPTTVEYIISTPTPSTPLRTSPSAPLRTSPSTPLRASPTPTQKPINGNSVVPQSGAGGTSSTNESYQYPTWIFPTVAPGQPGSKEWEAEFQRKWDEMTKQNQYMQQQVQQSQQQFCQQNPTLCGH